MYAEEGGSEIMTTKLFVKSILLFLILTTIACGGLRYSQLDPAAKDFHPQRIAVFPVIDVGPYEEARGDVELITAGVLVDKKWFADVTDTATLGRQAQANDELRKAMTHYLLKLRSLSFSDPELSRKIGELAKVDAFLLVSVDLWNYAVENDDKVAKVGIGMRLIDASTGKIMWKAGHTKTESYMLFKPALPKVARSLVSDMVSYMPR
jgi:hypothetical protein